MSKLKKFLLSLKKNINIKIVYKNKDDILNGKITYSTLLMLPIFFVTKKIFMLRLVVLEDLH